MKPIRLFLLFIIPGLALTNCNNKSNDNLCVANPVEDCFCITLYDPVCGCDGVTYGNACEAGCYGVEVACEGPCN